MNEMFFKVFVRILLATILTNTTFADSITSIVGVYPRSRYSSHHRLHTNLRLSLIPGPIYGITDFRYAITESNDLDFQIFAGNEHNRTSYGVGFSISKQFPQTRIGIHHIHSMAVNLTGCHLTYGRKMYAAIDLSRSYQHWDYYRDYSNWTYFSKNNPRTIGTLILGYQDMNHLGFELGYGHPFYRGENLVEFFTRRTFLENSYFSIIYKLSKKTPETLINQMGSNPVESSSRHAIFIELAGTHWFYSLNYDYWFLPHTSVRFGANYLASTRDEWSGLSIMINALYGQSGHYFEMGLGGAYLRIVEEYPDGEEPERNVFMIPFTLGYRYQPRVTGLMMRIAYTPFYATDGESQTSWGGVSLGYVIR